MSEKDNIITRMRDICDFIDDAAARVDAGEMVNLAGLDDDVASLCERTVNLPADDAAQIQPFMADMIGKLDRLGNALKDYQSRVRSGETK